MSEDTGNGDGVAPVIVVSAVRVVSSKEHLVRGFIALGVSFVATALASKSFVEANRAAVREALDASTNQ